MALETRGNGDVVDFAPTSFNRRAPANVAWHFLIVAFSGLLIVALFAALLGVALLAALLLGALTAAGRSVFASFALFA